MCVCVYIYIYIYIYSQPRTDYIYIYIYIQSATDRLFHCITTLQCGQTCKMLQAKIETYLTLCQADDIPLSQSHDSTSARELTCINFCLFTFCVVGFIRRALHYMIYHVVYMDKVNGKTKAKSVLRKQGSVQLYQSFS